MKPKELRRHRSEHLHSDRFPTMDMRKTGFIVSAAVPIIAWASFMNVFSGFSVVREYTFDLQTWNSPTALEKSTDGGYFVIGEGHTSPWARKVNGKGNVVWLYSEPLREDGLLTHYEAASNTASGGVVISGWQEKRISGRNAGQAGLILVLDSDGHEILRQEHIFDDGDHQGVRLLTSVPWGGDVAVVGEADVLETASTGKPSVRGVTSLIRMSADGKILWQKEFPMHGPFFDSNRAQVLANGRLAVKGLEGVAVIDADGALIAHEKLDAGCRPATNVDPSNNLQFYCRANDDSKRATILTLDAELQVIRRRECDSAGFIVHRAYTLADGAIALFGSSQSTLSPLVPTLAICAVDGSVTAKHTFDGTIPRGWLVDGVIGHSDGEFVTVREVGSPIGHAAITFLNRNSRVSDAAAR